MLDGDLMAMKRFVLGLRKRIGHGSKRTKKKTGICSEGRAPVHEEARIIRFAVRRTSVVQALVVAGDRGR